MISKFCDFILDKKRAFITLLVGLGVVFAFCSGLPKIVADFGYRVWFHEGSPRLVQFDEFERRFGSDELVIVGVKSEDGIFDLDSIELVQNLTEDLWQAPEVIRVDSITNYNWVHGIEGEIIVEPLVPGDEELTPAILKDRLDVSLKDKVIPDYLLSKNAKSTIIYVALKPSLQTTPDYETVITGVRKVLDKYKDKSNHEIHLTGSSALNYAFQENSQKDMKNLIPLVLLFTLLFLALSLRSVLGVLLPFLVIFLTIFATLGAAGLFGITINVMTSIVPQFMIALSIAVAVHLLASYYQFLRKGIEKLEALRLAIDKNILPTLLTTISTAIGFISFSTSGLPPIGMMGRLAAIGTVLAWFISFFVLIPLLVLLPVRVKKSTKKNNKSDQLDTEALKPSEFSYKMAHLVDKFKFPIIIVFSSLALLSIFSIPKIPVSSDPFKYFDPKTEISKGNLFVEENVGGSVAIEISIDSGKPDGIKNPAFLKQVEDFDRWLLSDKRITKTVSVIDILKQMNKTLQGGKEEAYVLPQTQPEIAQQLFLYTMNLPQGMDLNNRMSLDNSAMRLTAFTYEHESNAFIAIRDLIEKVSLEKFNLKAEVTGKVPLYQSTNEMVVTSFKKSLSLAIFLVALLMIIGLKSVPLGLFSMIPNAFPLVMGAGYLFALGKNLDIGTVVVGSVCLGIAVDDTIHFLTNYRKNRNDGLSSVDALAKIYSFTAPALITTTIVLVASFSTFIAAQFIPNRNFGILVSLILCTALIADLIFLPALLFLKKDKPSGDVKV